ncbi:SH3 domain-containing protein [Virgibacillus sp. FSP13]
MKKKDTSQISSVRNLMSGIDTSQLSSIQSLMSSIDTSQLSVTQNLMSGIDTSQLSSVRGLMSSIDTSQLGIAAQNLMSGIDTGQLSSVRSLMSSIDTSQLGIAAQNLMSGIDTGQLGSVRSLMSSIDTSQLSIAAQNLMSGIDTSQLSSVRSLMSSIDIGQVASFGKLYHAIPESLVRIDWANFKVTDEDIKQAHSLLENNNIEEEVLKEVSVHKDPNKISQKVKIVFIFIFVYFIPALNSIIQTAEYTEDILIPKVQSFIEHQQEGLFPSKNASIKWLNKELKKDVSEQITKNFRIVIKDDLVAYKQKTKDSRKVGTLKVGYVVQIIEKRKNWSYVVYSSFEDNQVIEGWVFTRYLKQIK